ncbi:MAG: sulfotransferase [Actinomycetia bacterium]|nr:sulfotransferase [Actinomycetes bacterium]
MSGLRTIYPGARFVHVYRDGRDVAHSVVPLPWGPNDAESALAWWEETFVDALREMRGHEEAVLLVSMEDLIINRRSENVERLFDFLGLPVDTGVQSYFEQHMSPERAHVGRWHQDLSSSERREMNLRYDAAVERIVRDSPSIELAL